MTNSEVLQAIADPAYQTELGAYNIEFNVPPRRLPGQRPLELETGLLQHGFEDVETLLNLAPILAAVRAGVLGVLH
ncbi:hypothetical protein BST36_30670, partial [Mycolicibacterium moriokaense]